MDNGYIQMDFPSRPPESISDIPSALLNGLSITPKEVLLNNQAYFVVYEHALVPGPHIQESSNCAAASVGAVPAGTAVRRNSAAGRTELRLL